jgi:hypothetical protein
VSRFDGGLTDAETGSNAGSNFYLAHFSDAGSFLGTAIKIMRSTGVIIGQDFQLV